MRYFSVLIALACFASYAIAGEEINPEQGSHSLREILDSRKEKISEQFPGLQLSAFGDVHSDYTDGGNKSLNWGAFEVNASIDTGAQFQGAMAFVKDSLQSKITVGFLDYHTFGGRIAPRGRLWAENGLHIQVGRFDVPFGSDWQFFASKDSVSISRPLTTELIMDGGYNDIGIRALGNNGSINFNAFLLQGFNAGRLVGGRIGVTPFSNPFALMSVKEPKIFELGLSYLYDANSNWKKNETAIAIDSEVHLDAWTGRFEYMARTKDPLLSDGIDSMHGWHLTQEYILPETLSSTIFVRYEQGVVRSAEIKTPDAEASDDRDTRLVTGFNTNFGNLIQWKFEIQHYLKATTDTRQMPGYSKGNFVFTQFVVLL